MSTLIDIPQTLIVIAGISIFLLLFVKLLKNKLKTDNFGYRIMFLREQNELLVFYKSVRVNNINNDILKVDNKTFNVIVNECSYINKKHEFVYYVDYDSGTSYNFYSIDSIQPDTLEMLVSNQIVREITKGLSHDKFDWKNFLFGVICGSFVMLIIMFIMKESEPTPPTYTTTTTDLFRLIKMLRVK